MSVVATAEVRERTIARGGAAVAVATMFASAANYGANVVLGRGLEAREFADAAMVVSGMLLLSALALGLQLTVARSVCAGGGVDAAARLQRSARRAGLVVGSAVVIASPLIAGVFEMSSPAPIALLGVGVPIFFSLAVRRGLLQATRRFDRLAVSLVVEPFSRLALTMGALTAGFGASSAALGLVAAFGAAWAVSRPDLDDDIAELAAVDRPDAQTAIGATVLLLVGQVVIANGDLWIVSALQSDDAGSYAAVALIGRLVYVAAWSIVTVLFPTLVQGGSGDRATLVRRGVGVTALVGGLLSAVAFVGGDRLLAAMIGDEFADAGSLLGPYAVATTLFVMSNLIAVADLAQGRKRLPGMIAAGAVVQTIVLVPVAAHGISAVVVGQLVVMAILFVATASVASTSEDHDRANGQVAGRN